MGDPNGVTNSLTTSAMSGGPHISVAPARPTPKSILQISTGVSAGLLLAPIVPIYPRIAINAHVEGMVKVEAIISKSGYIESAHVVSGPPMLHQAALEAIRNARYTPYQLNGAPTEVETTITVNFKLSS
jgi:protein TonB